MKNKIIYTLLVIMIIVPCRVLAAEEKITISCNPITIKADSTTECTIKGTATDSIIAVSSQIVLSENLTAVSFEPASIWEEDGKDITNGKIEVYSENDVNGDFTLGVLKIKAKSGVVNKNETITLKTNYENDKSNDTSLNTRSLSDATVSIRIPNNDSSLSSLEVVNHKLNKEFSKTITEYNLETTKNSVEIKAVSNDTKATIEGSGVISLNNGNNEIKIKVVAEDKSETTYVVNIKASLPNDDGKKDDKKNSDPNRNKTDDEITTNSETGSTTLIIVSVLMLLSLIAVVYFVKKKNINK